jgi:hypothetical protein
MLTYQQFMEEVSASRKGRALGGISSSDRPQATKAVSSGGAGQRGGMTMTPVTGLGRDYKGDKDKAKKSYDIQAKADRRAAAKERAASGEDRLSKLIRSVQKD